MAALRALAGDLPPPLVVLDGLWFAAPGAWDDGAGLPAAWPASPSGTPGWRSGGPPCGSRPRPPPARTPAPRRRPASTPAGRPPRISWVAPRWPSARRGWTPSSCATRTRRTRPARQGLARALAPFPGAIFGSTDAALGVLPGWSLTFPPDDPGGACWAAAFEGSLPARCVEALEAPAPRAATPPPSPTWRAGWQPPATSRAGSSPRSWPGLPGAPGGRGAAGGAAGGHRRRPSAAGRRPEPPDGRPARPLRAVLGAPGLRYLQPVPDGDAAPAVWAGRRAVALFAFGAAPRTLTLPDRPDLAGAPAIFGGPPFSLARPSRSRRGRRRLGASRRRPDHAMISGELQSRAPTRWTRRVPSARMAA
ncbi:MAG: hypothetical protein R3F60_26280 [bacterium]